MRVFLVSTLAALALAVPAVASADGAVVSNELGSLDGTFHDLNICGWPATFTTTVRRIRAPWRSSMRARTTRHRIIFPASR